MTRRRVPPPEVELAIAVASLRRPLCPWCQVPLRLTEIRLRPRLGQAGDVRYMACELCAWDMDGVDVPPMRVLH